MIGITSYVLISFWWKRQSTGKAGIKAIIINRIGDWSVMLGTILISRLIGSIEIKDIEWITSPVSDASGKYIGILMLLGSMGKSAQLFLITWLPDSMEGWIDIWNMGPLKTSLYARTPEIPWSTQFNLFGKIQGDGQSAGNLERKVPEKLLQRLEKMSSETKREELDSEFKYWLIGFTEGDGAFLIHDKKYVSFQITQSGSDVQVLYYIKRRLGFGKVAVQDKDNFTYKYTVRGEQYILELIEIFNGNILCENRRIKFKRWVETFNKAYGTNIGIIDKKNNPTLDNAWLAGFTDAEGCFTVSITKRSEKYSQVNVRYIISQKGELELMAKFKELLNGTLSYLKSYDGYNMSVHLTKLDKVLDYFNRYDLRTKKTLDFWHWYKIYVLVLRNEHRTKEGLELIKRLAGEINKKKKRK